MLNSEKINHLKTIEHYEKFLKMKDRITILYMIDRIAGVYGTEKHVLELISGLDKNIFSPILVALNSDVAPECFELSIPLFTFSVDKLISPASLTTVLKIIKIIRHYNVDIIETYHSTSDILGPIIGRLCHVKSILSNRRDMGFLRTKKHDWIYPWINKFVDRIKVVCQAAADRFSVIEKTDKEKYVLLYNGIQIERYLSASSAKRLSKSSFGIAPSEIVVGIVGNVKPIKGQMYLLDTACELSADHPNIKFLVVGGGIKQKRNRYLETLKARLTEKHLIDKFLFTGHRKDVPDIIQLMDIALLLSNTEGCSNVLLEYMASGKPVIATDVGGNPELILNNYNGFIVPPQNGKAVAEKIKVLIQNRGLGENMGRQGLELAQEKFSFKTALEKEVQLYIDLIHGGK